MSTGDWISIIVAIVAAASAWGAMTSKQAAQNEKIADLKAQLGQVLGSQQRNGERMQRFETDLKLVNYVLSRRRSTRIPPSERKTIEDDQGQGETR